jgi:hypothetical protein
MHSQLYGLQYSYVNKNGLYLVLNREPELELQDLAEIQIKMLQTNSLPKLLALQTEEQDLKVKLNYHIADRKILTHAITANSLSLENFYQLLYAIVSIIQDSKTYMLKEDRYVVNDQFIYIGKNYSDVYLVYLPLKELPEKNSLQQDLLELTISLSRSVSDLQGRGFQEIISLLHEKEALNLGQFKHKLLELLNNIKPAAAGKPVISAFESQENKPNQIIVPQKQPNKSANEVIQAISGTTPSTMKESKSALVQSNAAPLTSKVKTYMYLGAILAIALIWKMYLDRPVEGMLYICCGLSILVGDALYIILKIWKPTISHKAKENTVRPTKEIKPKDLQSMVKRPQSTQSHEPLRSGAVTSFSSAPLDSTTLLVPTDATVLLTDMKPTAFTVNSRPATLEVQRSGQLERISIHNNRFIIGRGGAEVQYTDEGAGVSKTHIEISKQEEKYTVQDLNSKNGSFLNEQPLVPYQLYPLKDGDTIRIIRTNYVFRLES